MSIDLEEIGSDRARRFAHNRQHASSEPANGST
jgi:hypothetical protein